jgi:hypothetical protein
MSFKQPNDEWKLEQGMAPAELPLLDLTIPPEQRFQQVEAKSKGSKVDQGQESSEDEEDAAKADDIAAEEDPDVAFAEEREGWRG